MAGYWYFKGTDGRRYCYAKDPTYVCPMSEPLIYTRREDSDSTELDPCLAIAEMTPAAQELGMNPIRLAELIASSHRQAGASRARVDGRLMDICATCGHRMIRKGYRHWIEETPRTADSQTRIAQRLGFSDYRQVEGSWYSKTKRDARSWAHSRANLASARSKKR
jgi:hypothetical protein